VPFKTSGYLLASVDNAIPPIDAFPKIKKYTAMDHSFGRKMKKN
jgi:hypothetical protein